LPPVHKSVLLRVKYDIIIIGGGIVGLATALRIMEQKPGLAILVVEKEAHPAQHQTGHNSGVIHSGIYYKPGSLKAINCIEGYNRLIAFCQAESIPYELCGKLIVATSQQELPVLDMIHQKGQANGLTGLRMLEKEALKEFEPHVNGIKGIRVPQTGIVDYKLVAQKMAQKLESMGATLHFGEKVLNIKAYGNEGTVVTDRTWYQGKLVINCAGLYSDKVARMTGAAPNLKIVPFRGEYYELVPEKEHLVKHLIYPVPDPSFPFLGVHFTRMIQGGVEAGPNAVLAFAREGYKKYNINPAELLETLAWPGFQKVAKAYWKTGMGELYRSFSKKAFTKALQKLIPEITEKDLKPGGAGVRAQACERDGGLVDDFVILENKLAINVCNAPSPAATSSLSIGQTVSEKALKRFA